MLLSFFLKRLFFINWNVGVIYNRKIVSGSYTSIVALLATIFQLQLIAFVINSSYIFKYLLFTQLWQWHGIDSLHIT